MPTYTYETIPSTQADEIERFEVRQSFSDPVLEVHPSTGVPVRRVISGGMGLMTKAEKGSALPQAGGGGCGPGTCGCGRF